MGAEFRIYIRKNAYPQPKHVSSDSSSISKFVAEFRSGFDPGNSLLTRNSYGSVILELDRCLHCIRRARRRSIGATARECMSDYNIAHRTQPARNRLSNHPKLQSMSPRAQIGVRPPANLQVNASLFCIEKTVPATLSSQNERRRREPVKKL